MGLLLKYICLTHEIFSFDSSKLKRTKNMLRLIIIIIIYFSSFYFYMNTNWYKYNDNYEDQPSYIFQHKIL